MGILRWLQGRLPEIDALEAEVQRCRQEILALTLQAQQTGQAAQEKQKELQGQLAKVQAEVCASASFQTTSLLAGPCYDDTS